MRSSAGLVLTAALGEGGEAAALGDGIELEGVDACPDLSKARLAPAAARASSNTGKL